MKDNNDIKVLFIFKHIEQNPSRDNKNYILIWNDLYVNKMAFDLYALGHMKSEKNVASLGVHRHTYIFWS